MDPMVGSSIAGCGAVSDSSDNAALLDFCFLCSRQFFHDNLDNYGTERLKDEDVLETFFEELGPVDRALLQCCPSCQTLCKTLTRTKEALSSLIDEITKLLLRSKKVSYLLSKSRIVSRLFQSSNISLPPCEVSSSYLQQPLSQLNFTRAISSNSNNSNNCFPTQFNLRLDSSNNLSNEDQLDISLSYSNTTSSTAKKRNFRTQSRLDKTDCSQELSSTCSSAFSCIYNDSIMNSVCDNACDISENIKVEPGEPIIIKRSDIETLATSSRTDSIQESGDRSPIIIPEPSKTQREEKDTLSFKSNAQNVSDINSTGSTSGVSGVLRQRSKSTLDTTSKIGERSSKRPTSIKRKVSVKKTTTTLSKVKYNSIKLNSVSSTHEPFHQGKNLKSPLNVNNPERKFICEICGVSYRHKKGLQNHVAIHKGESKFRCHLCYKSFSQNIGLKRHILRIHTRKFQYVCDICGKKFLHPSSFTVHKLIHSGVRNFRCPECDQTFLQNANLQRHLRTHTGEKRHRCFKCNRLFTEKYNLQAHMKSHEASRPLHECTECSKTYTRKFKLKQHMKVIHNILL